jgi:hypothetical protein
LLRYGQCPVFDAHHDRPALRASGGQVRHRPVADGQELVRGDGLEPVAQPGERAERQPGRRGYQGRRQPDVLGGHAEGNAAEALPPWKTTR